MCAAESGDDLHRVKVVPIASAPLAAAAPSRTTAVARPLGVTSSAINIVETEADSGLPMSLRHRILQANGRRYSINIEENYWTILDRIAVRTGIRVSQLVHRIASADASA